MLSMDEEYQARMAVLNNEMELLMAMPKADRQYFIQEERVRSAENYLQWMIQCNKDADKMVAWFTNKARLAVINYEMFKQEEVLDTADEWTEAARGTKENKFTIKDIRSQRERVQWEKKKLQQMRKPSTEQGQS